MAGRRHRPFAEPRSGPAQGQMPRRVASSTGRGEHLAAVGVDAGLASEGIGEDLPALSVVRLGVPVAKHELTLAAVDAREVRLLARVVAEPDVDASAQA